MARGKPKEKASILERQLNALELRKSGYTYREIASRLGVNHQTAYTDVNKALEHLAKLGENSAVELRQLELERLDRAVAGMMHWIDAGSPMHVQALVKCIQERAKLLGLYAPEEVKIDWRVVAQNAGVEPQQINAEFEELVKLAAEKFTTDS